MSKPQPLALDLSGLQHITGYLVAMVDLPARQVFQHAIGVPFHLREVEFTLLMLLRRNHGAAPTQLARALNMPAPAMTLLMGRMVDCGFIERRRSPADGRALEVHLTAKGSALADKVHERSLTMEDAMLQRLTPGERLMLRELLVKLTASDAPAPRE